MEKLWFKAKRIGWGWTPVTWEGWTVLAVYLLYMGYLVVKNDINSKYGYIPFFFEMIPPTSILMIVCALTGEKPRWRW